MYSIVPQKVWVTVPSWMDSLHRPKSVNFTCPGRKWSQGNNMKKLIPKQTDYLCKGCVSSCRVSKLSFVTLGFCTIVVEHDVLRLQVSVDDAFLVQVTQRHWDLSQVETVNRKTRRGSNIQQNVRGIKWMDFLHYSLLILHIYKISTHITLSNCSSMICKRGIIINVI